MKASPFPFPIFAPSSKSLQFPLQLRLPKPYPHTNTTCNAASTIPPPPPDFNYKNEILETSIAAIAETHPELLDLAGDGTLVLIKKSQYGPVPHWRSQFAEPEAIWIIGATHVSRDSASHVRRVIRSVRPDNVVVELCRSRAGIMYAPENGNPNEKLRSSMFSLTGTGFFGAVGRSINLGGQTALALRLLLATFSSKLSSDMNRPFGDEFRAARKASEEIGAQLVLGDRPIEITLERAWSSLTWTEKLSLVSSVLGGITSPADLSTTALEQKSNGGDGSLQLYELLSISYPSLLSPLLHERDTFMAWSLKRSKAVNGGRNVVGVIGKGHMNGVVYSLVSDQGNLRFKDLAGKKTGGGWLASFGKGLVRDTVVGVVLWLLYQYFHSYSG
ncbi:uncharacterized protein LOC127260186 [Andrographis paniculata]|uniref:uncharacterized protein LOC127260186 n=1 Tax=Andrographis paniculata TaxID=175694 RepID=UPI0021E6DD60|nr:uncharacterized protein LOC127260186 [Andrographis paniculata]